MSNHFPYWLVIPTDKAGVPQDGFAPPALFSSLDKMSAWLGSHPDHQYLHVRALDRQSAPDALNELRSRGCTVLYAELAGQAGRNMSVEDLAVELSKC